MPPSPWPLRARCSRVHTMRRAMRHWRAGRLLRAGLSLAVMLVFWLLSRPASAGGPICESRGSTVFAPPPFYLLPVSIEVPSPDLATCEETITRAAEHSAFEHGEGGRRSRSDAPESRASLESAPGLPPCVSFVLQHDRYARSGLRDAFRWLVERPPRL